MTIERKSLFDSIVVDLLRESPRTFKQLYPAMAERLPEPRIYASLNGGGRKIALADLEWLHEIERVLREVAINDQGVWHLKSEFQSRCTMDSSEDPRQADPLEVAIQPRSEKIKTATVRSTPASRQMRRTNSTPRKAPGVQAKETGTPLKRGAALQVMVYPRAGAKAVLVKASQREGLSLSSFLIQAGLEKASVVLRRKVQRLISSDEWAQYV